MKLVARMKEGPRRPPTARPLSTCSPCVWCEAASHIPGRERRAREGTSSAWACSSRAPEGGPPAPRPLECPLPPATESGAAWAPAGAGRGCTHLRKSSMWTTAGAIFSTTSAMKLNLYRGLVSWWRPAVAGGAGAQLREAAPGSRPEPPRVGKKAAPPRPPPGTLSRTATRRRWGTGCAPQRMVNAELPHVPSLDPAGPAGRFREVGTLRAAQPWWPLRPDVGRSPGRSPSHSAQETGSAPHRL